MHKERQRLICHFSLTPTISIENSANEDDCSRPDKVANNAGVKPTKNAFAKNGADFGSLVALIVLTFAVGVGIIGRRKHS